MDQGRNINLIPLLGSFDNNGIIRFAEIRNNILAFIPFGITEGTYHIGINDKTTRSVGEMWKCTKCGREFRNAEQDHFCVKPNSIDEYIAAQPEDMRPLLQRIRETIRAAAPEATEKISWQMPTFWQSENLIHFAAFKNHVGLYPGGEATSKFSERLIGYKTSKGAIQLPLGKPIDYELITDIVRWRVKQAEG